MALRLANPLEGRIRQVLIDFLPAELDLIDGEEGGAATPDVPNTNYHLWDRPVVEDKPAVTIQVTATRPISVQADGFGRFVDAEHRVEVKVHVEIRDGIDKAEDIQRLVKRYASGIVRVLAVMKDGLQTTADPARFVESVRWTEEMRYGLEAGQESGLVRTATIPLTIRTRDSRG